MDPLYFWKKYKLVASTKTFKPLTNTPNICRFCKQCEPKVTFNSKTHAVPELLGENNFISLDECDTCNNIFSGFESHLSIFFRPYLTMLAVKGKRKIPEFHSRTENGNEDTRTIIKIGENHNRNILLKDLCDYKIDKENKTMSITFRKQPHRPFWVYKSLVKVALSILPTKNISEYNEVFKWLLDKSNSADYFITAFITVLTRSKFSEPFADLYKAKRTIYKKSFIPEMTLVIGFGNIIVQIFLPLTIHFDIKTANSKRPELNLYPSFVFDKNSQKTQFTINAVDLKSKSPITYDEILHFSYQTAEFNIDR